MKLFKDCFWASAMVLGLIACSAEDEGSQLPDRSTSALAKMDFSDFDITPGSVDQHSLESALSDGIDLQGFWLSYSEEFEEFASCYDEATDFAVFWQVDGEYFELELENIDLSECISFEEGSIVEIDNHDIRSYYILIDIKNGSGQRFDLSEITFADLFIRGLSIDYSELEFLMKSTGNFSYSYIISDDTVISVADANVNSLVSSTLNSSEPCLYKKSGSYIQYSCANYITLEEFSHENEDEIVYASREVFVTHDASGDIDQYLSSGAADFEINGWIGEILFTANGAANYSATNGESEISGALPAVDSSNTAELFKSLLRTHVRP